MHFLLFPSALAFQSIPFCAIYKVKLILRTKEEEKPNVSNKVFVGGLDFLVLFPGLLTDLILGSLLYNSISVSFTLS